MKYTLLTFLLFLRVAFCQEDSLKTYLLEQITIKADKEVESKMVSYIRSEEIKSADAAFVSELAKLIPSAKVQTNSRGESHFYIRGASERQLLILLDGLPLNIHWDNRIDLSLIPSYAIREITALKGIPSVLFGANAIGGIINLKTDIYPPADRQIKLSLSAGSKNFQNYSASYFSGGEQLNFFLASSYDKRDGVPLSHSIDAGIFSKNNTLINTDKKLFNIFGKVNYNFSKEGRFGFSALYINSEKGAAPEMDVPNPRYWRYPEWEMFYASINGDYSFNGVNPKINFAFSLTDLKSTINEYTDINFNDLSNIEKGKDFIVNGRIAFSLLLNNKSIVKAALTGYSTIHEERIQSSGLDKVLYAQNVISAAAEYEYFFKNLSLTAGLSYDVSETPKAGNYKSAANVADFNLMTGLVYSLDESTSLHFSLGKKTRFPTLREAYSGALGRFVPNPYLRAEAAYSFDAGINKLFNSGYADLTFFISYLKDGIARQTLPEKQFSRVNKNSIRLFGMEFSTQYNLNKFTLIYFHLSYLNGKGKNAGGAFTDTLEYKPAFLSFFQLSIKPFYSMISLIEFQTSLKEFGLREGNLYYQKIPDYFLVNLRAAYLFNFFDSLETEIFIRVNNLFDRIYYSQWGIPAEGRAVKGGISILF